jgi:hypothetical protein
MSEEAKKNIYAVCVPSDHDILMKVVPSKEFFEKNVSDREALKSIPDKADLKFTTDEYLIAKTRAEVEGEYEKRLDVLARILPIDLLNNIATIYMKIRNIKGKVKLCDGIMNIVKTNKQIVAVRLNHALSVIGSFPTPENLKIMDQELKQHSNHYKKICKTSKIEAKTRKGF